MVQYGLWTLQQMGCLECFKNHITEDLAWWMAANLKSLALKDFEIFLHNWNDRPLRTPEIVLKIFKHFFFVLELSRSNLLNSFEPHVVTLVSLGTTRMTLFRFFIMSKLYNFISLECMPTKRWFLQQKKACYLENKACSSVFLCEWVVLSNWLNSAVVWICVFHGWFASGRRGND